LGASPEGPDPATAAVWQRAVASLTPRFRYGNLMEPDGGLRRNQAYQFYRLVPLDVLEIFAGLGFHEFTPAAIEEVLARKLWRCVDELASEQVGCINLRGVPVSAQLGRERVLDILAQIEQRTGIRANAPLEAMAASLKHLGAGTISVASRWTDKQNDPLRRYFEACGIEVAHMTKRDQSAGAVSEMSPEDGMRVALEVAWQAAEQAPEADAIVMVGGAALNLHCITPVEEAFGKPVLTNLNSEVWHNLIAPGVIEPVQGWGLLLAA
jgi:maleate isomerase